MARDFNGSSMRATATAPVTTFPFTASVWFYADDILFGGADKYIWSVADTGTTNNYISIFISDSTSKIRATYNAASTIRTNESGSTVSINQWNHAVAVYTSSSDIQIYLNGTAGTNIMAASATPTGIDTESIGALVRTTAAAYFDGKIAEVGVWNVALSQEEISALADAVSPLMVRPASLVKYSPLMGRTDPEIDVMGSYPFTLVNSPAQSAHPPMRYPGRAQAWKYGAGGSGGGFKAAWAATRSRVISAGVN